MSEQSHAPFHSEGIKNSPIAINTVLAHSGALVEGSHGFSLIAQATLGARITFEWRKVDDSVKHSQPFMLSANEPFMHRHPMDMPIPCEEGDYFIIFMPIALLGSAHASLSVQ